MSPPPTNSTPDTIIIHPGSGDFFLAEDRKKGFRIAAQIHKPTMAEKVASAIMSGTSPSLSLPLSLSDMAAREKAGKLSRECPPSTTPRQRSLV